MKPIRIRWRNDLTFGSVLYPLLLWFLPLWCLGLWVASYYMSVRQWERLGTNRVRVVDIRVDRFGDADMVVEPDTQNGHMRRITVQPLSNTPKVGEVWIVERSIRFGALSFVKRAGE